MSARGVLARAVTPALPSMPGHPKARLTLLASSLLVGGMVALGGWAGERLQDGVLQQAASGTVLNMDSVISPLAQELAH